MIIKAHLTENGVAREVFIDTAKTPVAIKFTSARELQRHANMLAAWPEFSFPMVIAPKTTPPAVLQQFMDNWPVQFFSGHVPASGHILDANGRFIDKSGD